MIIYVIIDVRRYVHMTILNVLEKIEENGFEAYIVGGYVRDYLLGIESSDIDVCTNARVKDIMEIFKDTNCTSNEYGSVKIITDKLRVDITTYRRDLRYNGDRRKVEIEYVDNLIDDINRRDFTMNTICMNKDKGIIDILNGQKDIENRIIRCVGNIEDRINEDPLRMLRAVRFATTLGFVIEEELYRKLKENKALISQLSRERIKEELTKILINKNAIMGLNMLEDLGFLPYIGIKYNDNIVNVADICGMYSQLELLEDFPFSKEEKDNIKGIQDILEYGKIDNNVLFDYGLYLSMVAGEILGVDKEVVTSIDKELPIRRVKDINVTSDVICELLGTEPGKVISDVYDELKDNILFSRLENNNDSIREYIYNNREKWFDEGADS